MPLIAVALIVLVMAIATVESGVTADGVDSIPRPTEPYVQRPACPFEGCQYGSWITETRLTAYASEGDTTKIAFMVAPGETITAHDGSLHVERIGRIVVRASVRDFDSGDTLLLLGYEGEGSFPAWHEGRRLSVEKFWSIPPTLCAPDDSAWSDGSEDTLRAEMVTAPLVDWWVRVSTGKGREGWLRLRNRTNYGFSLAEQIRGSDALE